MQRTSLWLALLALTAGACGGGGGDSTPTPPQQTVASVEVSPSSGAITLPGTFQLSATPRDAQGAAMSRTITWASSATNVATVSSSGLVTGVAVGTATISASADGKQGQASISVVSAVASVAVTPPAATINLPGTVQLTATARDAQGAALSDRTFTWSSATTSVATVSNSGLVTAVAAGTSVVTATADGRQGQATITVAASEYGPVVASADIGPAGGTVSSGDIGVTIPAGAFTSVNTITLAQNTVSPTTFPGNSASSGFVLDGIPSGLLVQTRVRVKYTGTNTGAMAIAVNRPAMAYLDEPTVVTGTTLYAATDSAGYLVATIPIKGKPSSWASPTMIVQLPAIGSMRFPKASEVDPRELKAAAELSGLINLTHALSSNGHFDVWGFGNAANLPAKIEKTGRVAEQGLTTITDMGYSIAHRTQWPIETFVMPYDAYGAWTVVLPFPVDPNLGYITFNQQYIDDADFPGTVIHELFHMTQGGFLLGKDWPLVAPAKWLGEATSTWIMEMHPLSAKPYPAPIALSWRDSLFTGLTSIMVSKSGYGKAPIIKYIAKRWGNAKVKEIYSLVQAGANPIAAMMMALPEQPELWWPDALNQHMGGSLYPWTVQQLVPKHTYWVNGIVGRQGFMTDWLAALAVQGQFLTRDTARFGPNFTLPVYLDTADMKDATIVAYQKTAASAMFRPLAAGDTVKIPGNVLQSKDSVYFMVTHVKPVAPYSGIRKFTFFVDLTVPEGDWRFPTIKNVVDGNHFTCDKEGNTVTMDVAANATSVWDFMAQAGTWKKAAGPQGETATYTWVVDPAMADTLTKYRITMQSTLTQGLKDSVRVQGSMKLDWTTASGGGAGRTTPTGTGELGWWWLLVPLSAVPFAMRRRLRRYVPVAVATTAGALVLASCSIGQIELLMDEEFDYTFTKMRFVADPAKPNDPIMQLNNGTGKTVVRAYLSSYWTYTTDPAGAKTDSTKVTCTGSGTSTYTADGIEYLDGVKPPTTTPTDVTVMLSRALGRNPVEVKRNMESSKR